jgi:serine/threonine-protein kinase
MTGRILWLSNDDIIGLTGLPQALLRFPADGSASPSPVEVTGELAEGVLLRSTLPDGRHVLAASWIMEEEFGQSNIMLLDTETGKFRRLTDKGGRAHWSPTGHLLLSRGEVLFVAPFDMARLELSSEPVAITKGLRVGIGYDGRFAVSANGTLAYRPGGRIGANRHLVYLDREGRVLGNWSPDPRAFERVWVSPEGSKLAVRFTSPETNHWQIWVSDMDRPLLRPLVAESGMDCGSPVWMPGADRLVYGCFDQEKGGGIYLRSVEGSGDPELLLARGTADVSIVPSSVSPDGSTVLVSRYSRGESELLLLPVEPDRNGNRQPVSIVMDQSKPQWGMFSPDGRWVIYNSDETGRFEMYIREFLEDRTVGPATLVTGDGGWGGQWSQSDLPSSFDLFYLLGSKAMAVTITTTPQVTVSEPHLLYDFVERRLQWLDLLPDGRFLAVQGGEEEYGAPEIRVVLNFHEEIRRKFAELE